MKRISFRKPFMALAMLVIALALGLALAGCGGGPDYEVHNAMVSDTTS